MRDFPPWCMDGNSLSASGPELSIAYAPGSRPDDTPAMDLRPLVAHCRSLPHVVEDVKRGNDLVFSIEGGNMFCAFSFENEEWLGVSFKVDDH